MRNLRRESGRSLIVVAVLVGLSAGVVYWKRVVVAPEAAFQQGLEAYRQHAFGRAAIAWREAEESGHEEAAFRLANLHLDGRGVERDQRRAVELFLKAAAGGHGPAQLELARLFEQGRGIAPDLEQAVLWLWSAAENDVPEAQLELGRMYEEGRGVEADLAEAVSWYHRAAEAGLAAAQLQLGAMYEDGHGVERSDAQAVYWLRLAAEDAQLPDAWYRIGRHHEAGTGGFERDLEQAVWCYEKAAGDRHADSLHRLGMMALQGHGLPQDAAAAARYFSRAAAQGHADASYRLARAFETGDGVPRDRREAQGLYEKAAAAGHVEAMTALQELGLRGLEPSREERRRLERARARERERRESEQARRLTQVGRCELYANGGTVVEMRTRMDCLNRGGSFHPSGGDAVGSFSTVDPERDWDSQRRELNRRARAEQRRTRSQGYGSQDAPEPLETDWVSCYARSSHDGAGRSDYSCSAPMRKRREMTTSWCRDRGYDARRLFKHESSARSWYSQNCR